MEDVCISLCFKKKTGIAPQTRHLGNVTLIATSVQPYRSYQGKPGKEKKEEEKEKKPPKTSRELCSKGVSGFCESANARHLGTQTITKQK